MRKIFDLDSPIIQFLSKIADLMILNILYLVSCIPIITIGAANAALYDVTGRLSRNDAIIWRHYWQAFASNFKKAIPIGLVFLGSGALLYGCAIMYWSFELPNKDLCLTLLGIVAVVWLCAYSWAFPLQARFENTVKNTLTNSLLFSWSYLPRTIVMAILNSVPGIIFVYLPGVFVNGIFAFLVLWFSMSAYLCTLLLRKPFKQLEDLN